MVFNMKNCQKETEFEDLIVKRLIQAIRMKKNFKKIVIRVKNVYKIMPFDEFLQFCLNSAAVSAPQARVRV